jgi:hypothetical protein
LRTDAGHSLRLPAPHRNAFSRIDEAPRIVRFVRTPIKGERRSDKNREGYMPTTILQVFVIGGLVLLFAMPALAQQTAGVTLRFIPHADPSILDPYLTGRGL